MTILGTVPRRCVNLPPGSLATLLGCVLRGKVQNGAELEAFYRGFGDWLGVPHVFGAATGRAAFQLALEALDLPKGSEIVFPVFTFPVMPMVAELLGYRPVFCRVDPRTYNAGPEHIEPVLTAKTGAVLATHLFGRPCPIGEVAELTRSRGIRLLEDCAHGLGVRVDGRQVGTFGDIGVFSFAEGKNMPCFGGGAIATADAEIAARARALHDAAPVPATGTLLKQAASVWVKWLATRPLVFGLSGYQALRYKQWRGQPLMDSRVGDQLLEDFVGSNPSTRRLANLQAALGLRQLRHIDAFNEGARRNAEILTAQIGDVPGVYLPPADGVHIYVYYPLAVDADKRDDLRRFLLCRGIDTKCTDMSDCSSLAAFSGGSRRTGGRPEASLLEICVYPTLSAKQMGRIARAIRDWGGGGASRSSSPQAPGSAEGNAA